MKSENDVSQQGTTYDNFHSSSTLSIDLAHTHARIQESRHLPTTFYQDIFQAFPMANVCHHLSQSVREKERSFWHALTAVPFVEFGQFSPLRQCPKDEILHWGLCGALLDLSAPRIGAKRNWTKQQLLISGANVSSFNLASNLFQLA